MHMATSALQRGCPRCGAPVPSSNLELHLLRCQPLAPVAGSVFGAVTEDPGREWACAKCTFLNAEEQQCCAMCGCVREDGGGDDDEDAASTPRTVLGQVFHGGGGEAEEGSGAEEAAAMQAALAMSMGRDGEEVDLAALAALGALHLAPRRDA